MLHQVDMALEALLRSFLPQDVHVRFDAPSREWADATDATDAAVVDLFPHRIEEDLEMRSASWVDRKDSTGKVIGRVLPTRRYRVAYLVTVWAPSAAVEHQLLGRILHQCARQAGLPWQDAADDGAGPVDVDTWGSLDVAHPQMPSLPMEGWSALGVSPRAHLDLVVGVTLRSDVEPVAAPPSEVVLGASKDVPKTPEPERRASPPRRRIQE